ncbi:MAG: NUDIX domain-containing protein [Actinobacteria bacterium]|nr:NUDIX domain-containing protein [Actinomycetota bacterium]
MTEAEVPIKPAATVMLLRDAERGLEVFVLRRTNAAVFARGMYVFPGGKVDAADGDVAGVAAAGVAVAGVIADEAYLVAAIRECYEEAGVLLAVDADGEMVRDGHPALAHRSGVYDGSVDIRALAAEHGLRLAIDALAWMGHWITPKGETSRRFDTRFFMTASPPGQTSYHDDNETVASMWVRPADMIERHRDREVQLMPPTIANLRFLLPHATVAAAMNAAWAVGTPTCVLPKVRVDPNGRVTAFAMPDDPGYATFD